MGLISEVFIEEKERSSIIGIYNGVMSILGAILYLIAGSLAVISWHNVFYLYCAAIPILILMAIFLPKTPPEWKNSSDEVISKEDHMHILKFDAMVEACFLFNALYDVVLYFISVYLAETHLGNAASAGIVTSAGTVGSYCACMLFTFVYQRLKRCTPIISYLVLAAAYIAMYFTPNIWIVGVMCLIAGASYGLAFSY